MSYGGYKSYIKNKLNNNPNEYIYISCVPEILKELYDLEILGIQINDIKQNTQRYLDYYLRNHCNSLKN